MLLILVVKEAVTGIMSLYSIKKTGQVQSAEWHGKVTTVLLYVLIIDRIVKWIVRFFGWCEDFWYDPMRFSRTAIGLDTDKEA